MDPVTYKTMFMNKNSPWNKINLPPYYAVPHSHSHFDARRAGRKMK